MPQVARGRPLGHGLLVANTGLGGGGEGLGQALASWREGCLQAASAGHTGQARPSDLKLWTAQAREHGRGSGALREIRAKLVWAACKPHSEARVLDALPARASPSQLRAPEAVSRTGGG